MTFGNRFANTSASDIQAGLVRPKPIRATDVAAVRANYGVPASFKPKGKSESQLYDFSVKTVLDWWKKSKAPPAPTGKAPVSTAKPPTKSGAAPKSGAAAGAGGATMPDTAMAPRGTVEKPVAPLPHIGAPTALAVQRGMQTATKATAPKVSAPAAKQAAVTAAQAVPYKAPINTFKTNYLITPKVRMY